MKQQIALFILGAIVGGAIIFSTLSNKKEDKSTAILNVLESYCDCEEIQQLIYIKGLESTEKGSSTESAEYELKNCQYSDLKKETKRINQLLIKKVTDYKDIDRFTLSFVNQRETKLVTIYNGKINY
ncbi:hypothetical protein HN014_08325 [Aquimarina sp. TRL1]|uniref:hypothetical protein n=1 Tax=Aquimarina sp. (strain TRL1) TaxID=2736252 RepID=UPI00158A975D|nr:hypothetical protein [Aquimarina sp. TRL1]QKX04924.1 hypothetical protein HN014_08325 [Aquimarina sp. TRL1]